MLYKDDWDQARARLEAWWAGEVVDRPVILVTAPRDGAPPSNWNWWRFVQYLDDPERAVEEFDAHCRSTYFGGEAFPNLCVNFGPGVAAAFMGAEPVIHPDTVWFETPRSWEELDGSVRFAPEDPWWQRVRRATVVAAEAGQGKWITGLTDLGGSLDIVASLRGAQQLVMDLIEAPECVEDLMARINSLWFTYYDELDRIVRAHGEGTSSWMGIWCPERWYPLQCDFSAMISPDMFARFVQPYLAEQCRWLDRSVYHWDGPGQLPHFELLLDIPELDGIQWTPGAGNPEAGSPHWFHLYRRIQERGKRLVLLGVNPADVPTLVQELRPEGLLINTWAHTQEEADSLLKGVLARK